MRSEVLTLFDEFAMGFSRGRNPDVHEFLRRAGHEAPALAALIDSFLAGVDPPPAEPERVEAIRAWARGEPPLLALRKSRRLKRDELVSRLTKLLGLAPERGEKVGGYYHELEAGLLPPRGVDTRVWDALRELLGTDVRSLARWRPPPAPPQPAVMYRARHMAARTAASLDMTMMPEEDEVDRLFRSGS